ncbi:MAG: hypothetical protein CML43_01045 [Rhodobacteraceae bacterium]|nr:hypothetical protein [Paracoccaceae bacterium]
MYHGYNAANNATSCCKWGRANGWIMMGHVEVLEAVDKVSPHHELRDQLVQLLNSHAAAMLNVQDSSGAWHQVLNETDTFLETSVTAMTMFSFARGIARGWLNKADYEASIHRAYAALVSQVQDDGTVGKICSGCGIQPNAATYNTHSTDYEQSQPGLGSVWRAVVEYHNFVGGRHA